MKMLKKKFQIIIKNYQRNRYKNNKKKTNYKLYYNHISTITLKSNRKRSLIHFNRREITDITYIACIYCLLRHDQVYIGVYNHNAH